jgi:hypothetical protein
VVDRRVAVLFARQAGLATVRQLLDAGATRGQIRTRLVEFWRVVLPGVVCESPRPLDARQRPVAALLYAGPGSGIASRTAAAYHGITASGSDRRVLVDVPHIVGAQAKAS